MIENPSAFPRPAVNSSMIISGQDGMTLRDWFAGGVASALSSATDSSGMWMAPVDKTGARIIAERAYAIADAMLAARATGAA